MSWSECCGCAMAFFCSMSATYDGAVLLWQCSTNKLFILNVILNVWLYKMTLEGARLPELHSSVSVASGTSFVEPNSSELQ